MNVYLLTPTTLHLDFRFNQRIIERIKRISGWQFDGTTKRWTVPATQIRYVMELFCRASFAPECFALEQQAAERFVQNMQLLGVSLAVDEAGVVVALDLDERHILHAALAERSDWLRSAVWQNVKNGPVCADIAAQQENIPDAPLQSEPATPAWGDGDLWTPAQRRIAEATITGIKNATETAEKREHMIEAQRRKRYAVDEQLELGI